MRKIFLLLSLIICSCATEEKSIVPSIAPSKTPEQKIVYVRPNNVIGAVEPVYFPPMKSAFEARIDTGATTSALDVQNLKVFERDGQKWVSFTLTNKTTGESQDFEKPRRKKIRVKRILEDEHRPMIEMDVKMGGKTFKADFTVTERTDFEYQALIGRNILSGRAIVDVSIENTLK
ncbi:MAG: ATP-dependent zinc protease [Alphaproteobacteria bacterium]|nr:ATP-dependent zinc protease [Alphaproteobacteria bacterium]